MICAERHSYATCQHHNTAAPLSMHLFKFRPTMQTECFSKGLSRGWSISDKGLIINEAGFKGLRQQTQDYNHTYLNMCFWFFDPFASSSSPPCSFISLLSLSIACCIFHLLLLLPLLTCPSPIASTIASSSCRPPSCT